MRESKDEKYDVIVAGSGPAGISTAMHMARLIPSITGRMIVLEKENHPRKKLCGGGISAYTDYWLKKLTITLPIDSLELKRTRFVFDHDEYMEYVIHGGGLRTVSREEFDQALFHKAKSMGIHVLENEPVISFSYKDNAVSVQTTKRSLETQVLVGADGVKSIIRRTLCGNSGIQEPRNTCSTLSAILQVDKDRTPEHKYMEAVFDFSCTFKHEIMGYAWSFPLVVKDQAWLNTGVGGYNISQCKEPSLQQVFMDFLADTGILVEKGRFEGHQIRWFNPLSIFSDYRVLLVGDAAGIDPLWGEGISFSLGYGEVAAISILNALKSKDFSFATYKEELLEHEIGQVLMERSRLADELYRSQETERTKDILLGLHGFESSYRSVW